MGPPKPGLERRLALAADGGPAGLLRERPRKAVLPQPRDAAEAVAGAPALR